MQGELPEIFGEARTYQELLEIFRRRISALGVTLESIDGTAGLPARYCQKLLVGVRPLGPVSFGPLLACVGAKILVVPDEQLDFARIRARLIPKKNAGDRLLANIKHRRRPLSGEAASAYFRVLRARQLLAQSPRKRKLIAKHAARARWHNGAGRHHTP
jgi:hypothetical protein